MIKIEKIEASEIKDSRGNPTIKVSVFAGSVCGSFAVPAGASTGAHEAHVISTAAAIKKVNGQIAAALIGRNLEDQKGIDDIMLALDGTANKDNLGGNTMIGVSIAAAKAAAYARGEEVYQYLRTLADIKPSRSVPLLYMNIINGGKHVLRQSSGQANNLAFQEYHVVPSVGSAKEAVEIGIKIQHSLKEIIRAELGAESLALGDEGGFATQTDDIRRPLVFLSEAIEKNNLTGRVRLALDVAASSFYEGGFYKIGGRKVSKAELLSVYRNLIKEFDLLSIEDPFDEEDFAGFRELKENHPGLLVVGDDLTVTNEDRLEEAIKKESVNAMIIKPNQIGTLSETLATMKLARDNNVELIVSHRSGETDDDFIADLAYAFGCFGLKAGAPEKKERKVKYDRLINISENIISLKCQIENKAKRK